MTKQKPPADITDDLLHGQAAPEPRPRSTVEPVHLLSPAQGEGVGEKRQTNAAQAVDRPRTRRRGGQPGNTNARKPLTPLSAIRRRVRALKRRARALLAGVEA